MPPIVIRPYTRDDVPALIQVQRECFPPPFPAELWWRREQIESHVQMFPEGALCALIDGEIVASATALIIAWNPGDPAHGWQQVSDDGFLRNHDPLGNSLYGVDVAVRPGFRRLGLAKALYQARYALVKRLRLTRFIAGSRLAGYSCHHAHMTPEDYAEAVCAGTLNDPVITPQIKAGLRPLQVVRDYLPDEESADCALLMEWRNG